MWFELESISHYHFCLTKTESTLLLKERTSSQRSKFFPLKADPVENGARNENGSLRIVSDESVPTDVNTIQSHENLHHNVSKVASQVTQF